jgi:uncharacterized membrane-anchored protein YhcB (DUF1043 family)
MINQQDNNSAKPPSAVIWHGIVQDRNDPLQAGRVRVRVIGLHTDDQFPTPIENLPWAQFIVPANASTTFSTPKEGEWVALYFADEGTYNVPIVMGVIPGIVSKRETQATRNAPSEADVNKAKSDLDAAKAKLETMKKAYNANSSLDKLQKDTQALGNAYAAAANAAGADSTSAKHYLALYEASAAKLKAAETEAKNSGVPTANDVANQEALVKKLQASYDSANKKYQQRPVNPLGDPRSQSQKDNAPQTPAYSNNRQTGKPSVPVISRMTSPKGVRQVKGDIVKYMDSLREHACDWTIGMRKEMSDIRSKIAAWIQAIRAAIDAAIAYLFGTPFLQTLKKAIAWIKAKIRLIKKIARIIQEKIAYYLDYLRAVLELIEFILTLPAQLLEMFQKCLTQLLGDFGATLKMATQLVTDPLGYTLKSIGNEFSKIEADPETPEETKFLQDLEAAGMPENPETP